MDADGIFESVPNFSEGRIEEAVHSITAAAAGPAHLLDVSSDTDHNRTVVSLAGSREHLIEGLLAAVAEAKKRIDLRRHVGVHPRVGAADVVPIVPLGTASLDEALEVADELARRIWSELEIPVFRYGHRARSLAEIRAGLAAPDIGGPALHPTAGAVCVGARRLLVAFNVLLPELDLPAVRILARDLRESSGGMRGVMALAFQLPGGRVQLSMNLFRLDDTRPADVIAELQRRGVMVGSHELVGLCPAPAAGGESAGRLVEARVAAAAARAAAAYCRARGDEERTALAIRLEREAGDLARLAVDQESLLSGAERAAALRRVLPAAGLEDAELDGMLAAAAAGLYDAITEETRARHAARLAALQARLT